MNPARSLPHSVSGRGWWDRPWAFAAGLALLGALLVAGYHNSFEVPFLLDDASSIVENETLRRFSTALSPPGHSGLTVSGRPLLNLSLAINHRIGGDGVFGYHVGNLLIHFAAAVCLFGVVRRTLRLPGLADRYGAHATPVAWFASALWALHPMQTESVTYIVQRAESLAGLFYLMAVYGFIRAAERRSRAWTAATVFACFLGVATKEVVATAPLVLFLYDRCFLAGSFRAAWECRRGLHLALTSSWLLLGALVLSSAGRGTTVGFEHVTAIDYLLTQAPGIAGYLLHVFHPAGLVFDYGAVVEKRTPVLLAGVVVAAALLAATLRLLATKPRAGFLGGWFFLILAPTSSIVPVATQTLAEHRMYLPLAAICVAACLAALRLGPRLGWSLLILLVVGSTVATFDRNRDYRSSLAIWEDTVRKVPDNVRALVNLGLAQLDAGRADEALRQLRKAVELAPRYADARAHLGVALVARGLGSAGGDAGDGRDPDRDRSAGRAANVRRDDALVEQGLAMLQSAVDLAPEKASLHALLAEKLVDAGSLEAALPLFRRAIALDSRQPAYHRELANVLAREGRVEDAEEHYRSALRIAPEEVESLVNYGALLRRNQRGPEALELLERAVRVQPGLARARSQLGVALLNVGRTDDGVRELSEALRLDPDNTQSRYHLGLTLARAGRAEEAIGHFQALLARVAPTAELLSNLGVLYAQVGRWEDALATTRRALEVDPTHAAARENLAKLTEMAGSPAGP